MGKRWKNYGVWVSMASAVGILLRIKYPQYLGDWTDFSTVIFAILVNLGILSNPTTVNKGYHDDPVAPT